MSNSPLQRGAESDAEAIRQRFVNGRLAEQIAYYGRATRRYKRWYLGLRTTRLVTAILTPVVLATEAIQHGKVIAAVLSALVAISTGLDGLLQLGDRWRGFRTTLELLKRERVLFETAAGRYRDPHDDFVRFVERIEELIAAETTQYFEHRAEKSDGAAPTEPGEAKG